MQRTAVVLAMAAPGALGAGLFGVMAAAFAGDASPTEGGHLAWFVWGILGGACVGATPGMLLGLAWRMKWVRPVLGGAVGALPGLLEACGVHVFRAFGGGRSIDVGGYGSAACALLGLIAGLALWRASANASELPPPS